MTEAGPEGEPDASTHPDVSTLRTNRERIRWYALRLLPWILFTLCSFRELELPGAYMDELNSPAFAPAILKASAADKPHFRLPDNILGNQSRFPIVGGSVYNSEFAAYLGAPFYKFWGFSLLSHRIVQLIWCAILMALVYQLARRIFEKQWIASAVTTCLALDPIFIFQPRVLAEGFVLMLIPLFIILLLLHRSWKTQQMSRVVAFGIGLCASAAVSAYWLAAALIAVPYLAAAHLARRNRHLWILLLATALFLCPYLYAILSIYLQAPAFLANFGMPSFAVTAQSHAPHGLLQKVASAAHEFWNYFLTAHPLFFTGVRSLPFQYVKAVLLIACIVFMFADVAFRLWKRPGERRQMAFVAVAVLAPMAGFVALVIAFASLTYHHMFNILPFCYLAIGYAVMRLCEVTVAWPRLAQRAVAVAAPAILLIVSLIHQQQTIDALRRCGGMGNFNERITQIPTLLSQLYPKSFIIFSDWGFHLPFLFLTAGDVPYAAPFQDPATWMDRALKAKGDIVVCAAPARTPLVVAAARDSHAVVDVRPITSRDGRVVYNFVHASLLAPQ